MEFERCREYENRLLEVILKNSPFLAEEMFKRQTLCAYDRDKVARMCEKRGLKHRALVLFEETAGITCMFEQANNITNILPENTLEDRMD